MTIESIAYFIGTHIIWLFLFGIASMLALAAALWRLLERYGESWWQWILNVGTALTRVLDLLLPRGREISQWRVLRFIQKNYLGIHALAGFAIAFVAVLGFIEFADELDERDAIGQFDTALASALRVTLQPGTYTFFAYITHLGDKITLILLGAIVAAWLAWRRQWLSLGGWLLALIGNGLLNISLKLCFQRVRPLHDHGFAIADGWSFPSGHSSGALVAYGMLAYLALRRSDRVWHLPLVLGAITIIHLVGGSRIILQVHYFTDVIAGFCSGTAWLAICIAGTEIASRHRYARAQK
ncbi:MAG: phosphatase PAP2 family protein [Spongiibacteraceae bacterium]